MAYFVPMKAKLSLCLVLLCTALPAPAQSDEAVRAALYLTGADSPEDLDDRLLEELESYRHRPLPVNLASRERMLESGLLSPYQIASLADYRSLSGDVLSLEELALVDGFGREAVDALGPFLSVASSRKPGEAVQDTLTVSQSAVLRATLKDVGAKYRISAGRFEAAGAWRSGGGTFYALYRTRRGKILLGDINARYGQGLAFWSAFQLSGLQTPEAFSKRANGITPSWSFSGAGTLRGAAWDFAAGPWQVALFGALDGTLGAHAGWLGRRAQAGLTVSLDRVSVDGKCLFRGVELFGEAAWRGNRPAALGGLRFPVGERFRGAVQLRGLPSAFTGRKYGEYGLAAGIGYRSDDRTLTGSWTGDLALLPIPSQDPRRVQVKSTLIASWTVSQRWLLESRLTSRYRSYEDSRTDLRADVTWTEDVWTVKGRLNGLYSGGFGALTYLEGGWKPPGGFGWLRLTLFSIPSWQARIYAYERDAPGNFTVPAYYGTGFSAMAYGGWKFRIRKVRVKLYLRGSYLWRKEKPGQAGLKFQLVADR